VVVEALSVVVEQVATVAMYLVRTQVEEQVLRLLFMLDLEFLIP
jgi:hypothetical protein